MKLIDEKHNIEGLAAREAQAKIKLSTAEDFRYLLPESDRISHLDVSIGSKFDAQKLLGERILEKFGVSIADRIVLKIKKNGELSQFIGRIDYVSIRSEGGRGEPGIAIKFYPDRGDWKFLEIRYKTEFDLMKVEK